MTPLGTLKVKGFWIWVAVAAGLGLAVLAAKHRIPWSDEGWFSDPAHNLAYEGYMGTTVLDPKTPGLTRIDQHTYWVLPLFLVGQGLWFMVFPDSILWTRVFSIVWAPVALWGWWAFLRRLFPETAVAALGTILLATSYVFIDNAGFARPDLMCMALGICGLGTYVVLRERSLPLAMLAANACIAASGLTHPNGIFHCLALGVVILWLDRRRLNFAAVSAAALPYMVFAGVWSIYVLQDKQAFLDQMRVNGATGSNGRWTSTWNPVWIVWNEIRDRYLVTFGLATRGFSTIKVFALLAYVAATGVCLATKPLRRLPSVQLLLTLLAVYFVAMSIFNQKLTYYMIHIVPVYVALLAVAICWAWGRQPRYRPLLTAAIVGLLSIEMGGIVVRAMKRSYIVQQREAMAFVRAQAEPGDLIIGSGSLLYELDFDKRLCDDYYLGLRSGRTPDIVIMDEQLYGTLFAMWQRDRPAEFAPVAARLASYQRVRQIGEYQIYLRPGRTVKANRP